MSQAMFQRQIKQHLVSNAKMAIIFAQILDLQFQLKLVTKNLKKIPIILFSVKIYKITIREVKETYDRPPCWHDGSKIIKNLGINIGRLFGPDILKLEESIFQSLIVTLLKLQLLRIFLYPNFNPILANHDHRIKILLRTKIYTSQYILYSVNNRQPIMLHLLLPRHKRYRTVDCMLHVLVIDHPFHLLLRSTFLACLLFYCFATILYFFLYDAYFRYGVPEFLHLLAHLLLLSESVENIIRILITPNKYHPNKYKQQNNCQVLSTCMHLDQNKKKQQKQQIKNQNKVQASQAQSLLHTPELLLKQLLSLGILQFLKILGETNPQIEHIPHLLLTAVHSIHMIIIHTRQRQHQNLHTIYIIVLNGIGKCVLIIDIFLIQVYMVFDEQFCYFGVSADTGPYQWSFPSIVDTENRQPFLYEDCPYFLCVALLNRCEYLTSEFVGLITEDLFGYDVLQGQLHFFQLVYNQLDICSEFFVEYFFTLSLHLDQLLISHRLFRCHFLLFFIRHGIVTQSFDLFQTIPNASRHFTPLFLRKLVREVSIIFTVFIEELFGILAVLLHFGIGRDIVVEAQEILAHFLLVQLFLGFFVQLLIDYGVLEGFHPECAYGQVIYIYIL